MKIPPVIIEFLQRVLSDNPKFFKWVQVVSAIVAVIAFMPDLFAFLEMPIPSWLTILHDKAIKVGALTAILVAQLPNPQDKK